MLPAHYQSVVLAWLLPAFLLDFYFIKDQFTGKGLGKLALEKLEEGAKASGIKYILASISSENLYSISFHMKNGFQECGRFGKIITKNGKQFDIVWMQKNL